MEKKSKGTDGDGYAHIRDRVPFHSEFVQRPGTVWNVVSS